MDENSTRSTPRLQIAIHGAAWFMVFLLHWLAFQALLPFRANLLRSLGNALLLALLFYGIAWIYRRFFERRQFGLFLGLGFLLFLLDTALRILLSNTFEYAAGGRVGRLQDQLPVFAFSALLTGLGIVLLSLLLEMARSRREREAARLQLITEQQAAQLQFLRAQINPHFLFNTLNNIYSSAVTGSDKTAPLVLRLSRLLEYVIYKANRPQTSLREEVELLKEYIDLFQLQHPSPQNISFELNLADRPELYIEPLLLVPLLENVFKHADFGESAQAYAQLRLKADDKGLTFSCINTYGPGEGPKDRSGGVGLQNIRRRLQLKYPRRHFLDCSAEDGLYRVDLRIFWSEPSLEMKSTQPA